MAESTVVSNTANLLKYLNLDQKGAIMAEYIWIDSLGELRSKCTTLYKKPSKIEDLKEWNFDGSSTGQAEGHDSDVFLRPAAMYPDPFRGGDNILVLAECYNPDGSPNKFNHRNECKKVMDKFADHIPWFGIEQEYSLFDQYGNPYGWPKGGFPGPQGPYYCGVGTGKVYCRDIVEAHYKACLYCGIKISGINAEVMPSQWEFQVGPAVGIEGGDHLWMARYLLARISEEFGLKISLHPKAVPGDWNGAGCHTNFSFEEMRVEGGIKTFDGYLKKLEKNHAKHLAVYGEDNDKRLTGKHETASMDKFSSGVANRGASVRIPRSCAKEGCGYLEDRRPASNMDPYQVTMMITNTCLAEEE